MWDTLTVLNPLLVASQSFSHSSPSIEIQFQIKEFQVSNFFKLQKSLLQNSKVRFFFGGGNLSNFHFKVLPTSLGIRWTDLGIRRGDGCDVQCGARTLPNHRLGILKNAGKIMENQTYGWSPWKKRKLKIWENHGQSTVNGIFQPFFCLEASDMGI